MKNIKTNQKGAILTEIAISLPVVFVFIFAILTAVSFYNARSALEYISSTAPRLALTRANLDVLNAVNTGNVDQLEALLLNNSEEDLSWYNNMAYEQLGYSNFFDLPLIQIYTIIYASQLAKESLGNITFPCDPDSKQNCFSCKLLNPSDYNYLFFSENITLDEQLQQFIGIECTYSLSDNIITPLTNMIAYASNQENNSSNIKISATKFYKAF